MTTDWKALCAELLESAKELDDLMQGAIDGDYMPDSLTLQPIRLCLERARIALDQPEPQEPTDEEILNLSEEHCVSYTRLDGSVTYPYENDMNMKDDVLFFARALIAADRARWGRPVTTQEAS